MFLSSALVTFFAFWILTKHLSPQTMRRVVGHKGKVDLCLHLGVILLFHGTFSGLMQAECAAIMGSMYLLAYRKLMGYELRINGQWVRFAGRMTAATAPSAQGATT